LLARSKSNTTIIISQLLSALAALVALTALIGYLYAIQEFYGYTRFTQMALHTAITLLILGVGILCTIPDRGIMAIISGDDIGGFTARRLLPATVVIPIIVGWLRLEGERHQYFGSAFGVLLVAVIYIVLFLFLVWMVANSLNHFDSKRKKAEIELRKLSRAVEQSSSSIVITDPSGTIEYVNPKFVQITGYSLEEAIGKNSRILKSGEMQPIEYKQLWDTILAGKEWRGEFHNKKKNDELYWESAVISPITDEKGNITHYLGVKEDITERKKTEQALEYEKTLLRILIDNITDTIYSKDMACRKTLANLADLKNMHVKSEAEVIGKDDFAFYPKEQAQEFYDDDQKVITLGKPVINKEECIIDEHGEKRWLLTNKLPLRNSSGEVIGLVGVGRDITDRKKSEEALRESEEKFRAIFENNSSAIAIINLDTTISMVNDAYCQMSGYSKEEAIGMSWTQLIPPDDLERLKEYNRRRLIDPQDAPEKYEFKFYHRNGEIRHGLMSVALIPSIQKIIASFADITERKLAETERERLIKELQYALENVKTLQGLIPICANCKKIRDDKGYWNQVEWYISAHTEAKFSHGICPDCAKKIYSDVLDTSQRKTPNTTFKKNTD
jgi:PAS domain S-box-containing protein